MTIEMNENPLDMLADLAAVIDPDSAEAQEQERSRLRQKAPKKQVDDDFEDEEDSEEIEAPIVKDFRKRKSINGDAKRPPNAFILYRRYKNQVIKNEFPNVRSADLCRVVAEAWKKEPEHIKSKYFEEAAALSAQHKLDYPDFVWVTKKIDKPPKKVKGTINNRTNVKKLFNTFAPESYEALEETENVDYFVQPFEMTPDLQIESNTSSPEKASDLDTCVKFVQENSLGLDQVQQFKAVEYLINHPLQAKVFNTVNSDMKRLLIQSYLE